MRQQKGGKGEKERRPLKAEWNARSFLFVGLYLLLLYVSESVIRKLPTLPAVQQYCSMSSRHKKKDLAVLCEIHWT